MQKIKNFIMKFGSSFAAFALIVGIATANSACEIIWHQPKEPSAWTNSNFKRVRRGRIKLSPYPLY